MARALSPTYRFTSLEPGDGLRAWEEGSVDSEATYCHQSGWLKLFAEIYRKPFRIYQVIHTGDEKRRALAALFFFQGPLSGKVAVGLPYLDYGGPLASNPEAGKILMEGLLQETCRLGFALELRSAQVLPFFSVPENAKVAMRIPLSGKTTEGYWKSLDAKVRNQVRKAEKSGVVLRTGGAELLGDFYRVFGVNMRDLGSPVHAQKFFAEMMVRIPGSEIVTAYRLGRCVGGLIRLQYGGILAIPWASTLRAERQFCPNNALYYDAIRTAIERGLDQVDLGRSTQSEGTYKFKKQWLAEEFPLYWYQFDAQGALRDKVEHAATSKLKVAAWLWSKLPLGMANFFGARIRPLLPA